MSVLYTSTKSSKMSTYLLEGYNNRVYGKIANTSNIFKHIEKYSIYFNRFEVFAAW